MSTDARFKFLLKQLEDWYADDVRAIPIDGSSGSHEPGHVILRVRKYPGPNWRQRWNVADDDERLAILKALEDEIYGLDHGPSMAGPAAGLHRGTLEFRRAVGMADGSLRAVARRFGISHTEVRRIRLEQGR